MKCNYNPASSSNTKPNCTLWLYHNYISIMKFILLYTAKTVDTTLKKNSSLCSTFNLSPYFIYRIQLLCEGRWEWQSLTNTFVCQLNLIPPLNWVRGNRPAIDPIVASLIKSVKCSFPCTVSCPHILMNSRKITIAYSYRWLWYKVKPEVCTNNLIIMTRWWLHGENRRLAWVVFHLFYGFPKHSVDIYVRTGL